LKSKDQVIVPNTPPRVYLAGEREAGVLCSQCQQAITRDEHVAVCRDCGSVHHNICWDRKGCGSYQCAPDTRAPADLSADVVRITFDQLDRTPPQLPTRPIVASRPGDQFGDRFGGQFAYSDDSLAPRPARSWWPIVAFCVAILGIPCFVDHAVARILIGLIAAILGVVALVQRRHRQPGVILGVLAVLIGIADFVGWTLLIVHELPGTVRAQMFLEELEFDTDSLKDQPPEIVRAMRSNVMIEIESEGLGLLGRSMGSGVILDIRDGTALVVTNRHVIDPQFTHAGQVKPGADDVLPVSQLRVKIIGQPVTAGRIVWIAPQGIDLALVQVPIDVVESAQASWQAAPKLSIGSNVFAIGNPHGLGWSHSGGQISQVRKQMLGNHEVKVLQTTAPINPGNSGGGLYDEQGRLLGINTWTKDKSVAEGLGFAITFRTLLDLAPPHFGLPQDKPVPGL
jgi:hypothetical protein